MGVASNFSRALYMRALDPPLEFLDPPLQCNVAYIAQVAALIYIIGGLQTYDVDQKLPLVPQYMLSVWLGQ